MYKIPSLQLSCFKTRQHFLFTNSFLTNQIAAVISTDQLDTFYFTDQSKRLYLPFWNLLIWEWSYIKNSRRRQHDTVLQKTQNPDCHEDHFGAKICILKILMNEHSWLFLNINDFLLYNCVLPLSSSGLLYREQRAAWTHKTRRSPGKRSNVLSR